MSSFDLGRVTATIRRRALSAGFRTSLKLAFGGSLRRLPGTLVAYLFGGIGIGSGASAAAASSRMVIWMVYELVVDGESQGSWVATVKGGNLVAWSFMKPDAVWPAPHEMLERFRPEGR